ncbi:RagB/SusD family nutrient uptake outer membrane protein [Hallella bergensis]|uniref:RagB/SusD family nutrient uptake outer membrane protein n=1 Tax=Hallella bergensis TaxID=242750 RepID=UPI0023F392D0|nr:RagB/SusD family nutrient uptake outer membrane protein [Hallella bergensis]
MKHYHHIITLLLMSLVTVSCNDSFLDKYPHDAATNETFWKTEKQLRAALYPCYEAFSKDAIFNWMEGSAETCLWGNTTQGIAKVSGGTLSYTAGFPVTTYWSTSYQSIYTCNEFLDNYNRADIPQAVKDVYAGEVKVIRAYCYFLLTTCWGDVPWVDHVITASQAYMERTPRAEVVRHLMEDLDWAAKVLPAKRQLGKDVGRIDRWGALAMKARIALQNQLWEEAVQAAKEVIDNSPYGLMSDYGMPYKKEGDTEINPANNESIIFSLYIPDGRMHNVTNETCSPVDYIRLNASKSLVDAYLCSDGKPAKAGLEYYHRNDIATSTLYHYPEDHYADYFKNRDPRMYHTLYCPGDAWPGGDDGDKEDRRPNKTFKLPRFSSLQGGINGANSRTGFYFKKYNDPDIAGNFNMSHNNLNIIRYPEVLLIYAEAMYNIKGSLTQQEIDYTINKLRDRVGMHRMILTELQAWNLDLQTELRRERRIEMTLDGMRYPDILRWKEGELRMGRAFTGPSERVCINDLGGNPYPDTGVDEFGDVIFEKSKAEGGTRTFDPQKNYLWPVPYAERVKNPLLGQNPGWPE